MLRQGMRPDGAAGVPGHIELRGGGEYKAGEQPQHYPLLGLAFRWLGDGLRIDPFTVEEVKELLGAAEERTRLFCLLMLNCGFTQKDISDIRPSEVAGGYITRKRSKRAKAKASQLDEAVTWLGSRYGF